MAKLSERKETLLRIIVAIVSGVVIYVWSFLTRVLIVLNFIFTLVTGRRHRGMAEVCEYWNTEMYKFSRYISFVSNARPFPFSDAQRMSKFQ